MRRWVLTLLVLATAACAPAGPGGQGPDGSVALVPVNAAGYPVGSPAASSQRTASAAAPIAARPSPVAAPVSATAKPAATTAAAAPGSGPPPIADDAIYNPKSLTPLHIVTPDPSKYEVVRARPVPTRPRQGDANIVAFALDTQNRVGQPLYVRAGGSGGASGAGSADCGRYASDDKAQEAFLEAGGPSADPLGLDPDGDGFACAWDPAPFRRAVQ